MMAWHNRKIKTIIGFAALLLVALGIALLVTKGADSKAADQVNNFYKINSSLGVDIDLKDWDVSNSNDFGDGLTNKDKTISVIFTSTQVKDSTLTLKQVVDDRLDELNNDYFDVQVTAENINNMDFYKVDLKGTKTENIVVTQNILMYATLNNAIYTTIQIFYEDGADLTNALKIVGSALLI